jgi:hypothetical protein
VASNGYGSDADSLDIDIVGESESSEEEDAYEGPEYFIEYASNSRAKVRRPPVCCRRTPAV